MSVMTASSASHSNASGSVQACVRVACGGQDGDDQDGEGGAAQRAKQDSSAPRLHFQTPTSVALGHTPQSQIRCCAAPIRHPWIPPVVHSSCVIALAELRGRENSFAFVMSFRGTATRSTTPLPSTDIRIPGSCPMTEGRRVDSDNPNKRSLLVVVSVGGDCATCSTLSHLWLCR